MSESVEDHGLVARFNELVDSYQEDLVEIDGRWGQATSGGASRIYDVRQSYAMGTRFDETWPDGSPTRPAQEVCWSIYQDLQEEYSSREGKPNLAGEYDYNQQFYVLCDAVFKDVIYTIPNYIHVRFDEHIHRDDIKDYAIQLSKDGFEGVNSISLNPTTDKVTRLSDLAHGDVEDEIFAPVDTWQFITDYSRAVDSAWAGQQLITMFSFKLDETVNYSNSWLPEEAEEKIDTELDRDIYEQYSDHFVMEVTSDEKHEGYSLVFSVPPGRLGQKMDVLERALAKWDELLS